MFSEIQYNKIQIYVIKIFEMTHPHLHCINDYIVACKFNLLQYVLIYLTCHKHFKYLFGS